MEDMKREFIWVKEKFEKGEIKVSLEHSNYGKKVFEGEDIEKKFTYFLDLFMSSLFLSKKVVEPIFRGVGYECSECGETVLYEYNTETCELLDYVRNKETNNLERGKCVSVGDYSFEVEIPTGVILCADRLPNSYNMLQKLDGTDVTLNSALGVKLRTLSYSNANIFHVFVGNSCPDVYKLGDTLYIGHSFNNECYPCSCGKENCDCAYEEFPPINGAKTIGGICTNLWWVSIVDISIYEQLLREYFSEEEALKYISELEPIETKIRPGVYKCTYFKVNSYDDYHSPEHIISKLEWVR